MRATLCRLFQSDHEAGREPGVTCHGSTQATRVSVGRLIRPGGRPAVRRPPGPHYTFPCLPQAPRFAVNAANIIRLSRNLKPYSGSLIK